MNLIFKAALPLRGFAEPSKGLDRVALSIVASLCPWLFMKTIATEIRSVQKQSFKGVIRSIIDIGGLVNRTAMYVCGAYLYVFELKR